MLGMVPASQGGNSRLGWSAALPLVALVASNAAAAPFRPDVLAALKAEGRLGAVVTGITDARQHGLDAPRATARGWLRPAPPTALVERQAIVLLVQFTDKQADPVRHPPAHYDSLLFSDGSFPNGSMRDWYQEVSYGQFDLTGQVTVWLLMPEPYAYYANGEGGLGNYPMNAQRLAEDAIAAANPWVDFSQFDNDGPDGLPNSGDDDGFVDALFVVHAGPGREATGNDDDIHSHSWELSTPADADGVELYAYTMEPEDGQRGIFGHEFGHRLGLPDLYDADYSSSGIGDWCMMSFGAWGNGGLTPAHFCAWAKSELGWVAPLAPIHNLQNQPIPRAEDHAYSCRLWTNGLAGVESFLVENRQRVYSDAFLPGDGLLIYHVDASIHDNTDESHPLLAVEQADGLDELAAGGASDAGDPFPGSTNNLLFAEGTNPDSRDWNGADTQVRVNVTSPSGEWTYAHLTVETLPNLDLAAFSIDDGTGGNGDGLLDPGESITLSTRVRNIGLAAVGVTGELAALFGQGVTILQPVSSYGNLGEDQEAAGTPPYEMALAAGSTKDAVSLTIQTSSFPPHPEILPLLIGVSDAVHFFGWEHGKVSAGYEDQWHLSVEKNHTPGGAWSWHFGAPGAFPYADYADGALQTDVIGLGPDTVLRFWHWIDSEVQNDTHAWDGGVLEVSVDGGDWTQITPEGGYPYLILPSGTSPFESGTPCFAGHPNAWSEVAVDLGGLGAWARLRWRFGSDESVGFQGWFIDDVTVEGATTTGTPSVAVTPVLALEPPSPSPARGPVRLHYTLPAPAPVLLTLHDLAGRRIAIVDSGPRPAGRGVVNLDPATLRPGGLASGVYFLRLQLPAGSLSRRLLIVR